MTLNTKSFGTCWKKGKRFSDWLNSGLYILISNLSTGITQKLLTSNFQIFVTMAIMTSEDIEKTDNRPRCRGCYLFSKMPRHPFNIIRNHTDLTSMYIRK